MLVRILDFPVDDTVRNLRFITGCLCKKIGFRTASVCFRYYDVCIRRIFLKEFQAEGSYRADRLLCGIAVDIYAVVFTAVSKYIIF